MPDQGAPKEQDDARCFSGFIVDVSPIEMPFRRRQLVQSKGECRFTIYDILICSYNVFAQSVKLLLLGEGEAWTMRTISSWKYNMLPI